MRFVAKAKDFLKGLQDIQGIAGQRSINPMLSETLIETADDGITIYATDLTVSLQERVKAEVAGAGSIVVQAKKMFEIARQLPEEKVTVETIDGNWLRLSSGHAKFKIVGLPPEEFPPMPEYDPSCLSEINFSALRSAFGKIIASMCENDARKYLNGGLMELVPGEGTVFVSTDSHRLSYKVSDIGFKLEGDKPVQLIIPRKSMDEIMRLFADDETVQMGLDRRRLLFRSDRLTFLSTLIDADYPDYRAVIPKSFSFRVKVLREGLDAVLKRVSVCSDPRTHRVRFFLKPGALQLVGEDAEIGEATDEVEAEYEGDGLATLIEKQKKEREELRREGEDNVIEQEHEDRLEIDYNASFFEDALKNIETAKVVFEFSEPTSGCVLKPDEAEPTQLAIVMPMGR
ncbi:MAG: DNA polymerase III subunit beta [Candidatus Coatesbacteria bacterium]|nr:DNA polymerase III subunit beta [Candidatus Coatesbacteria bacterium]